MDENETIEETTPKRKLSRKLLIITGATVGLILAGGLAFLKTEELPEETLELEAPSEDAESTD